MNKMELYICIRWKSIRSK